MLSLQLLCIISLQLSDMRFQRQEINWVLTAMLKGIKCFPSIESFEEPSWFRHRWSLTEAQGKKLIIVWLTMSKIMKRISLSFLCIISGGFATYLMGDTSSMGGVDIYVGVSCEADQDKLDDEIENLFVELKTLAKRYSFRVRLYGYFSRNRKPLWKIIVLDEKYLYQIKINIIFLTEEQMKQNRYWFAQYVVKDHDLNIVKCAGTMCPNGNLIVFRVECCKRKLESRDEICTGNCKKYRSFYSCSKCQLLMKYEARVLDHENPLSENQLKITQQLLTHAFL